MGCSTSRGRRGEVASSTLQAGPCPSRATTTFELLSSRIRSSAKLETVGHPGRSIFSEPPLSLQPATAKSINLGTSPIGCQRPVALRLYSIMPHITGAGRMRRIETAWSADPRKAGWPTSLILAHFNTHPFVDIYMMLTQSKISPTWVAFQHAASRTYYHSQNCIPVLAEPLENQNPVPGRQPSPPGG
jgi:hypothetical protein